MTRLLVVTSASIGLILFVAFIIARLLPSRTRGMSIRMQVFLALGLIVGTFAFGLGLMVIDRIEARAVNLATLAAEDEAKAIAGILQVELEERRMTLSEFADRLTQDRRAGTGLKLRLVDRQGRSVFPPGGEEIDLAGNVSVDAPLYKNGAVVGAVRVVKPTIVMRRMLKDFAPTVLVISLVLGAAAALAAAMIGRAIARPIEAISRFAERVSVGERQLLPRRASSREVARLTAAIQLMQRQLEGRPFVETFAQDLSHELKNPVAAIRASAEVLEESALEEPEEARRFVARIREAAERIERLLSELLSLARIEARGIESFQAHPVRELIERALILSGDRERVVVDNSSDAKIQGDEQWLCRAIINLVDNALLHSTPDAQVSVRIVDTLEAVSLEVENPGQIPEHVRRQLFRRFVSTRLDKGGSGLGLAIVRAVAEAHRGEIQLVEGGPPRVCFRLTLPRRMDGPGAPDLDMS